MATSVITAAPETAGTIRTTAVLIKGVSPEVRAAFNKVLSAVAAHERTAYTLAHSLESAQKLDVHKSATRPDGSKFRTHGAFATFVVQAQPGLQGIANRAVISHLLSLDIPQAEVARITKSGKGTVSSVKKNGVEGKGETRKPRPNDGATVVGDLGKLVTAAIKSANALTSESVELANIPASDRDKLAAAVGKLAGQLLALAKLDGEKVAPSKARGTVANGVTGE